MTAIGCTPYLDPPATDAPLRLFCFPHAGGAASVYRDWQRALTPHVSVWPVQLPGRGGRADDPRFVDLDALLDDLETELSEALSVPHAFFGHSMGALVAYGLARRRRAAGHPLPRALLLSAYSAPHLAAPVPPVAHLDDAGLARLLVEIGGLPEPVLGRPACLAQALPVVRDDLRLCAGHRDGGAPPLECPVHIYGAESDPLVGELDLRAWDRHTTDLREVRILPGGHFYLHDSPGELLGLLRSALRACPADRPVGVG